MPHLAGHVQGDSQALLERGQASPRAARQPGLEEDDAESLRLIIRQHDDLSLYHGMLRDLSTLLTAHYGEPTVILIDEYDAPIQAAYARGFYNDAVDFFRTFLTEGFKDNPNLFKGAMTGVLRVAKEGVLSGLNNVEVYSVLGDKYATAFGFTDAEVEKLAGNMGTPEVADELRAWYDGYRIGGHAIYNPWSVMMYAKHRSQGFKAHWVLTSSDDVLRPLVLEKKFAITQDLEALIRGETVSKVISEHVVLRELDSDEDAVWSLLLMSGYLTARTQETVGGNIVAELAIPNRDVRGAFTTSVMSWIEAGLGGADEQVTELSRAMLEGNEQDFATLLSKLLTTTMSYHDPAGREPERVYQAFVLGMLVHLEPGWHVRSNREAGHGRYDLAVIPKQPGKPGVVLELKSLDDLDDEKAEQALALALVQIRERRYAIELEAAGAEPIFQYRVVFDGKRARVKRG